MKRAGESVNDFEFAEPEAIGKVRVSSAGAGTGVQARGKGAVVQLPAESILSFRLQSVSPSLVRSLPALFHRPLHCGLRVRNHATHGLLLSPLEKRTDHVLSQPGHILC